MKRTVAFALCTITAFICCVPAMGANPTLKIISKPIYAEGESGTFSEGLIWVKSNDSFKYLDEDGNAVINSLNPKKYFEKSTRIVSVGDFHQGLALVTGNEPGEDVFINQQGDEVFSLSMDAAQVSSFKEDVLLVSSFDPPAVFMIDAEGNSKLFNEERLFAGLDFQSKDYTITDPALFQDGLIVIGFEQPESDALVYGYFDKEQNQIIKPQFDYALPFNDGVAFVLKSDKFGLIDRSGNALTDYLYDYVLPYAPYYECDHFREGLASVSRDGKFGFIHKDGSEIGEFKWDNAGNFSEGYCVVENGGKYGYVDTTGKTKIEPTFDDAHYFVKGVALVGNEDTYRLIDTAGGAVSYEVWKFDEVLMPKAETGFLKYKLDGKWGFARLTDEEKKTTASTAPVQTEGSMSVVFKNERLELNAPILNRGGRAMYPFRECLEAFGATVSWHAPTKTATGQLGHNTISFIAGSNEYTLNGKKHVMDDGVSSFIENDLTYIPIRYAAEGLGFTVEWDGETGMIFIY